MRTVQRGMFVALLFAVLTLTAAGCMPRGGMMNPGWTVVAATEDVVFAALATGQVLALDASNGTELWSYPPPQEGSTGLFARRDPDAPSPLDAVYGLPALTDKLVLVASYNKQLYAFERDTGRQAWTVPFGAEGALIGGATVYEDRVYVGSSDHRIYALDLQTGEPVWAEPFETGNWVWGAPAVDKDRVYVGSMDHKVYALDREKGSQVWVRDIGGSVPGSVTLDDGLLFVGGVDKKLHALRAQDGTVVWSKFLGHWVWGEALVHDGYVYVGSLDGKLHALAIEDGSERWPAVALNSAVRAGPVLLNGYLVMGTEGGEVYRVALEDGQSQVLYTAPAAVLSRPAVVGSRIYVGTTVGEVLALDAGEATASQSWTYPQKTK